MLRLNMKGMIDSSCGISFQSKSRLLWLVLPFMEISGMFRKFLVIGELNIKILATKFSPLFLLHCYNQVVKLLRSFENFLFLTKMTSLIRKEKITCENCGAQVTRNNIVRHKKRCSAGTLYCTQCSNFFTKSGDDSNYHIAKNYSAPSSSNLYKCKLCHAEFPGFYALCQHKNTQHGTQIEFGASNIDVEDIVRNVDDQSLREELESCKHFFSDTEMKNGRHRVFNFAMSSFDISLLKDKLDFVFKELKCAAKVNIAFGFVLKIIEDGLCRYFYAHENNTIMEKSKLVCTPDDIVNLKEKIQKMDIIDLCTRDRANTKWKFSN